jgi:DDE_Tnp_1-associated
MSRIAILEAFADLPDVRRGQGRRHSIPLCLAIFTLSVVAGNQGFLAIGDWIDSYKEQLKQLFDVNRLPSYSTIRRVLLKIDYSDYSSKLAAFLEITPLAGETIGLDGKVLRGSFMVEHTNSDCQPHPAIMLVSAYLVERGLILQTHQVDKKTNEIKALPELIELLALEGVVFAFDAINTQKAVRPRCGFRS